MSPWSEPSQQDPPQASSFKEPPILRARQPASEFCPSSCVSLMERSEPSVWARAGPSEAGEPGSRGASPHPAVHFEAIHGSGLSRLHPHSLRNLETSVTSRNSRREREASVQPALSWLGGQALRSEGTSAGRSRGASGRNLGASRASLRRKLQPLLQPPGPAPPPPPRQRGRGREVGERERGVKTSIFKLTNCNCFPKDTFSIHIRHTL